MSKATGDEKTAYEKFVACMRGAQEAATELGMHQSDPTWIQVGNNIGKMNENVIAHFGKRAQAKVYDRIVRGH
jgi:hypothetical protein